MLGIWTEICLLLRGEIGDAVWAGGFEDLEVYTHWKTDLPFSSYSQKVCPVPGPVGP